ncbi:hypothetical protein BJY00DRAFT_307821 [Aspergillus carlsbadensis]|nr:hypothetical protein BJY00DRAFT_307821 [Aspergillus carlsbadensis]
MRKVVDTLAQLGWASVTAAPWPLSLWKDDERIRVVTKALERMRARFPMADGAVGCSAQPSDTPLGQFACRRCCQRKPYISSPFNHNGREIFDDWVGKAIEFNATSLAWKFVTKLSDKHLQWSAEEYYDSPATSAAYGTFVCNVAVLRILMQCEYHATSGNTAHHISNSTRTYT